MKNLLKRLDNLKNKGDILKFLVGYEEDLEEYEEHLKIEGKTLEQANRENAVWFAYYDERRVEVGSVIQYLIAELDGAKGRSMKRLTEGYPVDLGVREKDTYMGADPEILELRKVYLQVKELHDKYCSVADSFKHRGFDLRNITNARVNALEHVQL